MKAGVFQVSGDCDPDTLNRKELTAEDERLIRQGMERYVPKAAGPVLKHGICMFIMTPDRHFIIDQHPNHPQVRWLQRRKRMMVP